MASSCHAMKRHTHHTIHALAVTTACFHEVPNIIAKLSLKMYADDVVGPLTPAVCLCCSRHCRTCISPYSSTRSASLMSRARCGWSSMRALSQLLSATTGSLLAGPTLLSRRASESVSSCNVAATMLLVPACTACMCSASKSTQLFGDKKYMHAQCT